jgi:hypothetical protein
MYFHNLAKMQEVPANAAFLTSPEMRQFVLKELDVFGGIPPPQDITSKR